MDNTASAPPAPMAASPPPPSAAAVATPSDPTFRNYTATQAVSYLAGRPAYPDALTQSILTHHTTTGGQLTTLLDVGCGPGTATQSFAPYFSRAFGVDPSVEMINAARGSDKPSTGSSAEQKPIHFAVCAAESLPGSLGLPPASVDLLTAATAAHWFDMAPFWQCASSLVRPGGTVALWTSASYYCHPHTTPNAAQVQRVLNRLEQERLAPYKTRGNMISNSLYRDLGMPWDSGAHEFPEAEFVRKEWNVGGEVEEGGQFLRGNQRLTLKQFVAGFGTASMVTRWREAHPDLVGTDEDVISVTVRELREALGGQEWFEGGSPTALLLFKKR